MSGFVKRAWLLMYAEGGRWKAGEIRTELGADKTLQVIQTYLGEMARRNFIIRYKTTDIDGVVTVEYGVAKKCKVPRGVTVDEMWDILQMAQSEKAEA